MGRTPGGVACARTRTAAARQKKSLRAPLPAMAATSLAAAALFALATDREAGAYTPTVSASGVQVRWEGGPKLNLVGNPVNASGLSEDAVRGSLVRSVQRWVSASLGSVGFDYWQGTDDEVYVPNSDYNGTSSIYFASHSNSAGGAGIDSSMIGLTQVWYNATTGAIMEVDTVLNDVSFEFTTNPADTTGFGAETRSTGDRRKVFIENVVTHELGHSLGLSHSGSLQATMLFMEAPEQAHLSCDDQAGIRAIYPTDSTSGRTGAISGKVVSQSSGRGVFGAHVQAISRHRGTVLASAVTASDGTYTIGALEAGDYFLMVEPFFAGSRALPSYFASSRANICTGNTIYGRSFLADGSTGKLETLTVTSGATLSAPTLTASCGTSGAASVESRTAVARSVAMDSAGSGGFGFVDRFGGDEDAYAPIEVSFQHPGGALKIHALAYSLYSPVGVSISLLDASGAAVLESTETNNAFASSESGYTNHDGLLTASDLAQGTYRLRLSATAIDAARFPAGSVAVDSVPFVVVTTSQGESDPELADLLADNARCTASTESLARYDSPTGDPETSASASGSDSFLGACGTIVAAAGSPGNGGGGDGGPTPAGVLGFFVPFLAAFGVLRFTDSFRTKPLLASSLPGSSS